MVRLIERDCLAQHHIFRETVCLDTLARYGRHHRVIRIAHQLCSIKKRDKLIIIQCRHSKQFTTWIAEGRKIRIYNPFHSAAANHMAMHALFASQIQNIIFTCKEIQIIEAPTVKRPVSVIFLHKITQHDILDILLRLPVVDNQIFIIPSVNNHIAAKKLYQLRRILQSQINLSVSVFRNLVQFFAIRPHIHRAFIVNPHVPRALLFPLRKRHLNLFAVGSDDDSRILCKKVYGIFLNVCEGVVLSCSVFAIRLFFALARIHRRANHSDRAVRSHCILVDIYALFIHAVPQVRLSSFPCHTAVI